MPRKKPRQGKALLRTLHENPQLPAFIERLDAPVLNRLIEHVGLEDAGEIIAYATTRQLQEILDERLWVSRNPGDPEQLSGEEFLRWLETWNEIRRGFAAEKLVELGEAFAVLCLSRLVTVVSPAIPYSRFLGFDYTSEDFGEYVVRARRPEQWDPVLETLTTLWEQDEEFLTNVLRRCCFEHSMLAIEGEVDKREMFHADAAGEREREREQRGFVTPLDASIFLAEAKGAELEELAASDAYDVNTARHFELRRRAAQDPPGPSGRDEEATQSDDANDGDEEKEAASPPEISPDDRARLAELEAALVDAEIVQSRNAPLLLAGPNEDPRSVLTVRRALEALHARLPDAFDARLAELGYLSNILMAACEYRGRRFEESETAQATLALCNLGLAYLHASAESHLGEEEFFARELVRAPALVKAFQIGWNLTYKVPLRTIARLFETLYSPELQAKLGRHPWLAQQIGAALPNLRLAYLSGDGAREVVRDLVEALGLVFDHTVCQCLTASVDTLPCYPLALDDDPAESIKVNTKTRFFSSMADLQAFDRFLASLPHLVSI